MFRSAVLSLVLAAPAAAQPPTPQPPPPIQPPPLRIQPAPVPDGPIPFGVPDLPPGVRIVPQPFVTGGGGGGAPRLVVAKVEDGALVWTTTETAPTQRQITATVIENGQPVTRQITTTMMQPTTKKTTIPLDNLKVKDRAGKKVRATSLEIRLGEGTGIVVHSAPVPDEIRAMFKDDVLFVEVPGNAPGFAMPAFAPPPGGPQPAPAFDFIRPAPVPAPAERPNLGRPTPTPPPAPPRP